MPLIDNSTDFFLYIRNQYPHLTPLHQKIADYFLDNSASIVNQSTAEISQGADVSEASVVRFCRNIGFKGLKDLKIKLAGNLAVTNAKAVPNIIEKSDDSLEVVSKMMQLEYEDIKFCLEMLDKSIILDVLHMINESDRLAFFGVGSSAIVAENAKERFLHYGKSAQAESETFAQITLANSLGPTDLAFAISTSGNTLVPIQAMEIAKRNGARTVCITQNPHSKLAKFCDKTIFSLRKSQDLDDLGTATRIVQIAVLDAISVAYATSNWDKVVAVAAENRSYFKAQKLSTTHI